MLSYENFQRYYGVHERASELLEGHAVPIVLLVLLELKVDRSCRNDLFRQHGIVSEPVFDVGHSTSCVSGSDKFYSCRYRHFLFNHGCSFMKRPAHEVSEGFNCEPYRNDIKVFKRVFEYRSPSDSGRHYSTTGLYECTVRVAVESVYRVASSHFEHFFELFEVPYSPGIHSLHDCGHLSQVFERPVVEPEHIVRERIDYFAGEDLFPPIYSGKSCGFLDHSLRHEADELIESVLTEFLSETGTEPKDVFGIHQSVTLDDPPRFVDPIGIPEQV